MKKVPMVLVDSVGSFFFFFEPLSLNGRKGKKKKHKTMEVRTAQDTCAGAHYHCSSWKGPIGSPYPSLVLDTFNNSNMKRSSLIDGFKCPIKDTAGHLYPSLQ
jgi:hypothetical protein